MAILISVAVLIIVMIKTNANAADKNGKNRKPDDE